jgi:predicted phosphodiesterase
MKEININFISKNIAPYEAESIGIFDNNDNLIGKVNIGQIKPDYGERLYRFGLLSDVHNQNDTTAEPDEDLQNALAFFNEKESVSFTCICGDITENGREDGREDELKKYKNNVNKKSPSTPVYTCTGNHDCIEYSDNTWEKYTGNKRCFSFEHNGDVFIFFSMRYWSLGDNGHPYNNLDIEWLTEQLNINRNKRTFIFTHLFFPDLAGNFMKVYPSGNWLGGEQLNLLSKLRTHFKNSIWFSGHSHWKWYLQKYQKNTNIAYDGGWTIHVPSCASPIDSMYVGNNQGYNYSNWTRDSKPLDSEGAIIDVYDNYIDVRGIVFKEGTNEYTNKYCSIATYRILTTIENVDEYTLNTRIYPDINSVNYINSNNIHINTSKPDSENIEITDLSDDYVLIKFDAKSTGVVISTGSDATKHVKLIVDDIQISYDDTTYSNIIPDYFGFYTKLGNYTIQSCEDELELGDWTESGNKEVQFNVSSKYTGDLPIYCKLKCKLLCISA